MICKIQSGFHKPPFPSECFHESGFLKGVADVAFGTAACKKFQTVSPEPFKEYDRCAGFSGGKSCRQTCRTGTDNNNVKNSVISDFRIRHF